MEYLTEELAKPVSPIEQWFDILCTYVLIVFEFEVPIHNLQALSFFKDTLISIPRFTSIMVCDDKGVKRWKQVEMKWEEHFTKSEVIDGMSLDSYDKHFSDYLSRISMENLPPTKPLWQIHVIKYPTSNAAGTLVLKFHHSIGDGYTLMGLLLSSLKRVDNPSLPLSFPTSKTKNTNKFFLKKIPRFLSMPFNSVKEFGWSVLKSTLVEDDKTPIRSGFEVVDYRASKISSVTFPINNIKEIKSNLRVSINDVISGIVFYGIRLYMQEIDDRSKKLRSTALVMASTRNVKDYQSVDDMLKTEGAWGNHVTYLHVSMPKLKETPISNPLQFVLKTHTSIKRKRNSFAPLMSFKLLQMKNSFQGTEATAKFMRKSATNTSLLISNMVGPLDQMALANHPIKSFFFTVSGVPQSLVITIMSYMGMLRVTTLTEEGFIDEKKLVWYLNNSYEIIHREAAKVKIP